MFVIKKRPHIYLITKEISTKHHTPHNYNMNTHKANIGKEQIIHQA